ncbi:S8 family serine peptidase [Bacteroidales bacterium OttesenSCG-928-I21]|nr:S8 family serine peptidase [Bacteroidales bacterium OttesenSCG-928-I21]
MKKIFNIITLLLMSFVAYSQASISTILLNELEQTQKEYLNLNIYFHNKEDISSLASELDKKGVNFDTRVKEVIKLCKANAEYSHLMFKINIEERKYNEEKIFVYRQDYWIVNMINADVKTEYIYELLQFNEISHIDLNSPRYEMSKAIKSSAKDLKSVNGAEPGLKAIKADKLWALGYTGRNVLFLSVDTGVNPDHPAISNNFAGNYLPLSQCWHGLRHEEPVDNDQSSSHGTHTTGTSLGLNPTTNDTIGVAFNAKWIASDPVASTDEELLAPTQLLNIYEWALNPDGDDNTTDDVPRVINNSWGFDHNLAALFGACDLEEAQLLVTLETAGICSPFSAGNEGPSASTTGFPAMRVFNDVNPMAIGALNANLTIANFSSRGPSPCVNEEGALKIKPEVSAPGVNVRSCSGTSGYAYLSGTSMSCPHVAGALLLLSEAFPNVSAYELKKSLYLTAIQLGEEEEDNTFGRGLIDVFAAYELLCNTYTPTAPITNQHDLKVEIIEPNNEITCTNNNIIPVKVRVSNEGTEPITNFNLSIYINDNLIRNETKEQTLNSGEYFELCMSDYEFNTSKNTIHAIAKPEENLTEYDRFNNGHINTFFIVDKKNYPMTDSFENTDNLIIINPDAGKTWEIISWGENDEYKALGMNFKEYTSIKGEKDFAYLPKIKLPEKDSIFFNLIYAYKNNGPYNQKDSLIIELSTDCGNTFPHRLFAKGGTELATVPGHSFPWYKPVSIEDFDTLCFSLKNFKAEEIIIKLTAVCRKGSVLYINEVNFYGENEDSGTNEAYFNDKNLKIFPNPVTDIFKIKIPENINSDILEIYDTKGQLVQQNIVKGGTQIIHLDKNLKSGQYYMKLKNSGLKSKIVKN